MEVTVSSPLFSTIYFIITATLTIRGQSEAEMFEWVDSASRYSHALWALRGGAASER